MDSQSSENAYSDKELYDLFCRLFPCGFDGADVKGELKAADWSASPFHVFFHPTPERLYQEYVSLRSNISRLTRKPPEDMESWEDFRAEFQETPSDPNEELTDLIGLCCWGIFSDNNKVLDATGRSVDIGSFRGAGAFLAFFVDSFPPQKGSEEPEIDGYFDRADHMRFYMGSSFIAKRGDLGSVYCLIFRRLKSLGLVWVYNFPRLNAVDMSECGAAIRSESENISYDPEDSLRREREAEKKRADAATLREELDRAHQDALDKARHAPPPETVKAYMFVYRCVPKGWPPQL